MSKHIEQIEADIIEGKVKPALVKIKEILAIVEHELQDEAVMLLSSFNRLQSKRRKGILAFDEEELQTNKIIDQSLSLFNEIKEDDSILEQYNATLIKLELVNKEKNISFDHYLQAALTKRMSDFKLNHPAFRAKLLRIGKSLTRFDQFEAAILRVLGLEIDYANTSEEAQQKINENDYRIIISSVEREGSKTEGFDFHLRLVREGIDLPFIFYIGFNKRERGVPPYAFGITHSPNELVHLVLDVLERGGESLTKNEV